MTQIYIHIENDIGYSFKRYGQNRKFLLIKAMVDDSISTKKEKRTIIAE